MSTAAAVEGAVPVKAGKKKLVIVLALALLLLAVVGGAAVFWLRAKAQAAHEAEQDEPVAEAAGATAAPKRDPKVVPVFVALDSFTVNLADREAERYAQIGITLELDDPKVADEMKVYMPAIRDAILMILAHKTSAELLERAGKEALAAEIMRESVRPMGIETGPALDRDGKPIRPAPPPADNPVRRVLFSSFIIQ